MTPADANAVEAVLLAVAEHSDEPIAAASILLAAAGVLMTNAIGEHEAREALAAVYGTIARKARQ